jgi:hypothetical protein
MMLDLLWDLSFGDLNVSGETFAVCHLIGILVEILLNAKLVKFGCIQDDAEWI